MFGLFASTRTKATRGATAALQPMIGILQVLGGPGIPAGMWHDPYILGFTHQTIGIWAHFLTRGKATVLDLGFALPDVYSAISNMNGRAIANLATDLGEKKDPEFQRGISNATTYYLYAHDNLKDEAINSVVIAARKSAIAFDGQLPRSQITSAMCLNVWVREVERVAGRG